LTSIHSSKTSLVYNALNYPYRKMSKEKLSQLLKKIGLDVDIFFLHVGHNNWYKNKYGLFRIFKKMISFEKFQESYLVLAGKPLTKQLRIFARNLQIHDRIREIHNPTNEQLRALYSSAKALIFPSFAEGFGWPVIEAQSCGCPVFASNRKPMTEIGGLGAAYFDPLNEFDAARVICESLKDKESLIENGYKNASQYNLERMINGYTHIYKNIFQSVRYF